MKVLTENGVKALINFIKGAIVESRGGNTDAFNPLGSYPIGTLYLSYESTSPAQLFGGTWIQITNVVLRAANDTDTGGLDNVTITTLQLPSHGHNLVTEFPNNSDCTVLTNRDTSAYNVSVSTVSGGDARRLSGFSKTTANTGGGNSITNLPAYQNIYCWRRTA